MLRVEADRVSAPFQHEDSYLLALELLDEHSISYAEYSAQRDTAGNTNPSISQNYSQFRIWLLS